MFIFGDIVQVKAFQNEVLTRRVVGDNGKQTIYLCNEKEFQAAKKANRDADAVGFPMSDIIEQVKDRATD